MAQICNLLALLLNFCRFFGVVRKQTGNFLFRMIELHEAQTSLVTHEVVND